MEAYKTNGTARIAAYQPNDTAVSHRRRIAAIKRKVPRSSPAPRQPLCG